jgi:sulfonate transport system substrate-binding protein
MKRGLVVIVGVLSLLLLRAGSAGAAKNGIVVKVPLLEWTAVASQKGWLQEEFGKLGARSELVDFNGMKIPGVEASLLDKEEMHFGFRMQYPSLQHKLNGLDAIVVWQSGPAPVRRNTIVVLKDSPIKRAEELKGKNLGSWRISCPYFSAFEILKTRGVPLDTDLEKGAVRYVNISGFAQNSALLAGKLDSISVHPSAYIYTPLYTQGLVREVATSVPGGPYVSGGGRTSVIVTRDFAKKHPGLIRAYLIAYERTRKWIVANPDAAATIIARDLRVPRHVARYGIVDDSSYNYVAGEPAWDQAVDSIKKFQKWAIANNDDFLKKRSLTDAQVEAFVDRRFFKGGEYSIY